MKPCYVSHVRPSWDFLVMGRTLGSETKEPQNYNFASFCVTWKAEGNFPLQLWQNGFIEKISGSTYALFLFCSLEDWKLHAFLCPMAFIAVPSVTRVNTSSFENGTNFILVSKRSDRNDPSLRMMTVALLKYTFPISVLSLHMHVCYFFYAYRLCYLCFLDSSVIAVICVSCRHSYLHSSSLALC